jgi:hypothetical protein
MTRPNRDLDQAGHLLMNVMAVSYTQARHHLALELSYLDGYPAGNDEPNVTSTAELTTVERCADARLMISTIDMELEALKAETLGMVRALSEAINRANTHRAPRQVKRPDDKTGLCCSNQAGKHDSLTWGDPLCLDIGDPARGGLCPKHYMRWWRARKRDGIDVSREHQPA